MAEAEAGVRTGGGTATATATATVIVTVTVTVTVIVTGTVCGVLLPLREGEERQSADEGAGGLREGGGGWRGRRRGR